MFFWPVLSYTSISSVVAILATSISSFIGKTGKNITSVLNYAKTNDVVLLLDEFDSIAKRRDDPSDLGELKRIVNVLHKGNWKGYDFFILSIGTHPTAYVRIPKEHKYYRKHYDRINIDCHYGLTFSDKDFHFNLVLLDE